MTIVHPRDDLAAYALGALDRDERQATAAHLDGCAECRAALAGYEKAAWAFAETAATPPPAGLRERVVARERQAPSLGSRLSALLAPLGRPVPLAVPLTAVLLLVASLVALRSAQQDADAYARAVAGVADGRVVALAETGESGPIRGALVIPSAGRPYLVLQLPEPPTGRTWAAWVIRGEVPLAAGITEGRSGVVTLLLTQPVLAGDAVAVTLEPAGGRDRPSGRPVLLGRT